MASTIDIVNRGLSKLGDMRITALSDETAAAQLANSIYEVVRDAEIAAHAWLFATARAQLPALADKPAFGWSWQYELPADCLRLIQAGGWPQPVIDNYINRDTSTFTIEGRNILTNLGPALNIIYLRRETDTSLYPPVFIESLACKLAVEMAESLTGSTNKRQMAWQEYDLTIKKAKRVNAICLPPQAIQDDSWMLGHMMGVL